MRKTSFVRTLAGMIAAAALVAGVAPRALAASSTANFTVGAAVTKNCTISTSALAFGSYDPVVANASANLDGTGALTVGCTRGATATIALSAGSNSSGSARRMGDGSGNFLSYGVWRLARQVTNNSGDTLPAGSVEYAEGGAYARAKGWAIGLDGGLTFPIIKDALEANVGVSGQYTQEDSYETSTTDNAVLQEDLLPGEKAYVAFQWTYNRHQTKYRLFDVNGETRRSGSDAYPAPSLPYRAVWDFKTAAAPTLFWKKINSGDTLPEWGEQNQEPIFETPSPNAT